MASQRMGASLNSQRLPSVRSQRFPDARSLQSGNSLAGLSIKHTLQLLPSDHAVLNHSIVDTEESWAHDEEAEYPRGSLDVAAPPLAGSSEPPRSPRSAAASAA